MVYRRGGKKAQTPFYVALVTRTGAVRKLSTQTTHRPTAQAMEEMLERLRERRDWDLLEQLTPARGRGRPSRAARGLTLPQLFDAWRMNDLAGLRARLADVDLTEHLEGWRGWLTNQVKPDTAEHYVAHLRTLMPAGEPFLRSQLTKSAIAT